MSTNVETNERQILKRIRGLDTLRFCLALWVIFAHCDFFPLVTGIDTSHFLGRLIQGLYNNIVSGPAAVIVFFVISGVCIHFPYRHGEKLSPFPYYTRRYIRIVTPMIVAILLAWPLDIKLGLLDQSILWSLLAEEIYYAIYPLLLRAGRTMGWLSLIVIAYLFSLLVILQDPTAGEYPAYGPYLNWLLGLPCWLFGCHLADRLDALKKLSPTKLTIFCWRVGVWVLSSLCSVLRFHSPVKYPWTLNIFVIVVYFWLKREVAYYLENDPPAVLEKCGKWSYSMYLFHVHANLLYFSLVSISLGVVLGWLIRISFILAACYTFYLFIEQPSHKLAKAVARKLFYRSSPEAGRQLSHSSAEIA